MARSMTGFGRGEAIHEQGRVTVEIKSVNHRYLDLNIKIPKKLNMYEASVRNLLKEHISRGKVDIYIGYESYLTDSRTLRYHEDVAAAYIKYLEQMHTRFQIQNDLTVTALAHMPEVFTMEQTEEPEEDLEECLLQAMNVAIEAFLLSREEEGERLCQDLTEKIDQIRHMVDILEERSPKILEEYRARLEVRLKELLNGFPAEEGRIVQEVVLYADRICVDEEIVRLKSHVEQIRDAVAHHLAVGRKLDFIAQELNREANTILSKSSDILVADIAIDLKTEIEKVREQIQNIE